MPKRRSIAPPALGAPRKRQGRPKRFAKQFAASRTETISVPVTFRMRGGDGAVSNERSAYELASRCQITLNAGTAEVHRPPAVDLARDIHQHAVAQIHRIIQAEQQAAHAVVIGE